MLVADMWDFHHVWDTEVSQTCQHTFRYILYASNRANTPSVCCVCTCIISPAATVICSTPPPKFVIILDTDEMLSPSFAAQGRKSTQKEKNNMNCKSRVTQIDAQENTYNTVALQIQSAGLLVPYLCRLNHAALNPLQAKQEGFMHRPF